MMKETDLGDPNSSPLLDHFVVWGRPVTALEALVHLPWQKAWKAPVPRDRGPGTFDGCRVAALLNTASVLHRHRFGVGLRYAIGTDGVVSKLGTYRGMVLKPTSSFCLSSFSSRKRRTFVSRRAVASLIGASVNADGVAIYSSSNFLSPLESIS